MAASYFDVDGTLVSSNLIPPTLYYLLHLPTPLHVARTLGRALLRAPAMAWAEWQDRRMFNEALFTVFDGMSEDRLITLADDVFERVLKPKLYKGARDLVQTSIDQGHEVILVSGALDVLMKHMAAYLGATGYIANRLEIKDRFATGKLLRPVVAGPNKALLVRDHARSQRSQPRPVLRLLRQLLRRADALDRGLPRRGQPRPPPQVARRRIPLAHHQPT